jgi:hypothetical protein
MFKICIQKYTFQGLRLYFLRFHPGGLRGGGMGGFSGSRAGPEHGDDGPFTLFFGSGHPEARLFEGRFVRRVMTKAVHSHKNPRIFYYRIQYSIKSMRYGYLLWKKARKY